MDAAEHVEKNRAASPDRHANDRATTPPKTPYVTVHCPFRSPPRAPRSYGNTMITLEEEITREDQHTFPGIGTHPPLHQYTFPGLGSEPHPPLHQYTFPGLGSEAHPPLDQDTFSGPGSHPPLDQDTFSGPGSRPPLDQDTFSGLGSRPPLDQDTFPGREPGRWGDNRRDLMWPELDAFWPENYSWDIPPLPCTSSVSTV